MLVLPLVTPDYLNRVGKSYIPALAHACDILQRMQKLRLRAIAADVIGDDWLQQESAHAVSQRKVLMQCHKQKVLVKCITCKR